MDELLKTLEEAYDLLKTIAVSGSGVDTMFYAKDKMRRAYQIAAGINERAHDIAEEVAADDH